MFKKINGRVIEIANIETFLKAYEGMQRISNMASLVDYCFDGGYQNKANNIIKVYQQYHEGLPFPLVAIEDEIKYVTLAHLIQEATEEKLYLAKNGLLYPMNDGTALKLQNSYWAIVDLDSETYKTDYSLIDYSADEAFEEFSWVYRAFKEDGSCEEYYSVFLSDFLEACLNEELIIQFELENILNFGFTPCKKEIPNNALIYLDDVQEKQINLRFIERGFRRAKRKDQWAFENGLMVPLEEKKPLYDLNLLMESEIDNIKREDDIKTKLISLYAHLVGTSTSGVQNVKGIIANRNIVYQVGDGIFTVPFSGEYHKPEQIALGAVISSYEDAYVYIEKDLILDAGIIKKQIYSYNCFSGEIKLVKISFHKQLKNE